MWWILILVLLVLAATAYGDLKGRTAFLQRRLENLEKRAGINEKEVFDLL